MRITDLVEDVDFYQLSQIESFVEALWDKLNIDVKFTRHFLDRLNDPRNGKPITSAELIRLFKKEYERNGKDIAQLGDVEAVMKDLLTNINLPFVMKDTPDGKELVAKTIMRKPNFKTPNPEFIVQESKSYQPPELNVGDEVKVGKWKNRKTEITGFKKDENNQPVLKTTKGDQKLFKPRISKLQEQKATGDCFHVAGRNVLDGPSDDLKLVHAMVTGQGELKGKRFPHAWNEIGDVVLDYSNGKKIVMRKEQYYKLGHVDTRPGNFVTYDSTTALKKMARHKHWGPWDLVGQ